LWRRERGAAVADTCTAVGPCAVAHADADSNADSTAGR
jgi:hypothetical protein